MALQTFQPTWKMQQSIISYFIPAEIQLSQFRGLRQGCGQVSTGFWGHATALQAECFQSAVLMVQSIHKCPDAIVTDAVVAQVQFS